MNLAVEMVSEAISQADGIAYVVGGATRDMQTGQRTGSDYDLESFGLWPSELAAALGAFLPVKEIGKGFGVFQITVEGTTIEISIPRKETKIKPGRKGFDIALAPRQSVEKAALRRDFTCNAIYYNPLTEQTFDPLDGRGDIKKKVLRACSPVFVESPDRVLRAMQLSSRLDFDIDSEVMRMSRELRHEAETIPVELRAKEWWKWATMSHAPVRGLQFLEDVGWLNLFPVLNDLRGVGQDPEHHPEGDVWQHTKLTVKHAYELLSPLCGKHYRATMLYAALLHDSGKPLTQKGYTFHGHEKYSEEIAGLFCRRMQIPKGVAWRIGILVRNHMAYIHCRKPKRRTVRRLAAKIYPVGIATLVHLMRADAEAKGGAFDETLHLYDSLSWDEGVRYQPMERILTGKMLIRLGVEPGPEMGEILKCAYNAQLAGKFKEECGAIMWYKERSDE